MEADMGMTQQAMREHDRHVGDENLYVKFFSHPLQDKERTLQEGRPIYVDTDYIQIMVPGDKGNVVVRPVRPDDVHRFPKQHLSYKSDLEEVLEGTPLEKWNYLTQAQVEELKYFGIRTVEQLAVVSDSNAQKFMGIQILRQKAVEYVKATKTEAPIAQLQEELEQRDLKIQEQDNVIGELMARMEELEKKAKAKGKAKED